MHARGLRLRGVRRVLALAHPLVLPSAMLNDVGTPVAIISQLHILPARTPVSASMAALRLATHDSGPGWLATPFLYDSFIHYSTPVYPGALSSLLENSFERGGLLKVFLVAAASHSHDGYSRPSDLRPPAPDFRVAVDQRPDFDDRIHASQFRSKIAHGSANTTTP